MAGLLVIAFVANLAIRAVASQHYEESREQPVPKGHPAMA